ncbi:MAG: HlyD family efflux transporter periplasmic adaptor subunit [Halieaceae bacterium]
MGQVSPAVASRRVSPGRLAWYRQRILDGDIGATVSSWLDIHCGMISGMTHGDVFWVDRQAGGAEQVASWPPVAVDSCASEAMVLDVARNGRRQLEHESAGPDSLALDRLYWLLPVAHGGSGVLVTVLEMASRPDTERVAVLNILEWGAEWLNFSLGGAREAESAGLSAVFRMAAACLDQDSSQAMEMSLVSELAAHLNCQRVSLGLRKGKQTQVQVLSHSARFEQRSNLIRMIALAMDEAIDQDRTILFTPQHRENTVIVRAHSELAGQMDKASVLTLPFTHHGEVIGALTLECNREAAFPAATQHEIEQLLAVLAPVIVLKQHDEQSLPGKVLRSLGLGAVSLFGPGHIKFKLSVLASLLLAGFFLIAEGSWRIAAPAVIEGSVQRTVAAPIDGYISQALARAGDIVEKGGELGALDDRELKLERLKWATLRQQMVHESREAMAQRNLSEVNIISARIKQADAELSLLDEQLARIRLLSPLDGVVIEGDLSQMLGTPVARGDVLFKVAPLDDYRIVMLVDEKDIAPIAPGQAGSLILTSMPNEPLDLEITRITSVSTAQEGGNFFQVEAILAGSRSSLRPGMEGVAKIEIGNRRLISIWTRDLANWLRLQIWTWWR